jgi:hypothetical protein
VVVSPPCECGGVSPPSVVGGFLGFSEPPCGGLVCPPVDVFGGAVRVVERRPVVVDFLVVVVRGFAVVVVGCCWAAKVAGAASAHASTMARIGYVERLMEVVSWWPGRGPAANDSLDVVLNGRVAATGIDV